MQIATYPAAPNGLATDFSKSNFPEAYARGLINRFRNAGGGYEKRQGIQKLGSAKPDCQEITNYHEYISNDGTATLYASGIDTSNTGSIWKYDSSSSTWSKILSGKNPSTMFSIQPDNRLIFVNGVDRNFFTNDNGATFDELRALSEDGRMSGSTNSTTLIDGDVTNWIGGTFVAQNDIVRNVTAGGFGLITTVASAQLVHTPISTSALGIGASSTTQKSGDFYQIIDSVELNIFDNGGFLDNVAVAATGTSNNVITVSAFDFSTSDIREGDFVSNTTRNALTRVTSVSANINIVPVTGQISGDSLVFLKSAMPIASYIWQHYGRTYFIDARDKTKVRVSGIGDPQDLTTQVTTIDAKTFDFGAQQAQGQELQTIKSFQRFLVFVGSRSIITYEGTDPIQDSVNQSRVFTPISLSPQGCVSRFGAETDGNNFYFVSTDGLQGLALTFDARSVNRENASEPIKNTLRDFIELNIANTDNIKLILYSRRNWMMLVIGDQVYVYNYGSYVRSGGAIQNAPSWSLFTGVFAQQGIYFVRNNGDLVCGNTEQTYIFDQGNYDDDGSPIPTEWLTGFTTIGDERVKSGKYWRGYFEVGAATDYNIGVLSDFDANSSETITVTANSGGAIGVATVGLTPIGGTGVDQQKIGLRWRGEEVQFRISNSTTTGPDIISKFDVFYSRTGII